MEKFQVNSKDDIVEERYKGPSAAVAAAGEGFLRHFAWALIGVVVGGVASSLAHNKVSTIKQAFQEFHSSNREHAFFIKRWTAKAAGLVVTASHALTEHIPGHQHLTKRIPEKRLEATLFGAGLLGAIGYASGWLSALFTGTAHSNNGKHQFNRAKAEIKDLRERNDDLEKVNNELHKKYVEAATQKDTAGQEQPTISESAVGPEAVLAAHEPQAAMAEKPSHKIHHQADAAMEHHGKIHAHQQHEHAAHSHA